MVLSIKISNLSYEKASGCWCAGAAGVAMMPWVKEGRAEVGSNDKENGIRGRGSGYVGHYSWFVLRGRPSERRERFRRPGLIGSGEF